MAKSGGQPGNSNAAKGREFRDALRYCLANYDVEKASVPRTEAIYKVAAALITNALTGDNAAIREIADRIDGKPVQESHSSQDVNLNVTEHITVQEARDRLAELVGSGIQAGSEGATIN